MKTRKVKGFTLIELIVVIAIIGVLAAILVPTLMQWTMRSKIGSNNATAKTIFTAFQAELTELETRGVKDGQVVATTLDSTAVGTSEVADAVNDSVTGFTKNMAWTVTNDGYEATAAVFSSNGDDMTGGYPNPAGVKINVDYADAVTNIDTWAAAVGDTAGDVAGWNVE